MYKTVNIHSVYVTITVHTYYTTFLDAMTKGCYLWTDFESEAQL